MTILNVKEVTRGGRIGDSPPSPYNSVTFLMGRVGGGCFLQALAFLLALFHSPSVEKSGFTSGLKSSFRICKL